MPWGCRAGSQLRERRTHSPALFFYFAHAAGQKPAPAGQFAAPNPLKLESKNPRNSLSLLIFTSVVGAANGDANAGNFRTAVVRGSHSTTIFAGGEFSRRLFFAILKP
jgi:hypothetical protein